jgi:hypothetical protein
MENTMEDDYIPGADFDSPDYASPCEIGDVVMVTGTLCTSYTNGGTAILKHSGTECEVTKSFWDYETGWGFHGRVVDPATVEDFRAQSASSLTAEQFLEKHPNDRKHFEDILKANEKYDPGYVYFSEHDLAPRPKPGMR